MRELDCLIISTARAASTAVYQYLNARGQLGLPANKEPHFWCDVRRYEGRYELLDSICVQAHEEYEGLYAKSVLMIDASVGYFFYLKQVVQQLADEGQRPKVVFLYREPVSRAASLFNELRKKGLEQERSVLSAVQQQRKKGLWWENYYDNVAYDEAFEAMRGYFPELVAVNYAAIQKDPHNVISYLLDYLGVKPVHDICYTPVNSSAEAGVQSAFRSFQSIIRLFPTPLRKSVVGMLLQVRREKMAPEQGLAAYLPFSVEEYLKFREKINREDIFHVSRDCS